MTILSSMLLAKEFMVLGSKSKLRQKLNIQEPFEGVPPSSSTYASISTSSNMCAFMA